MTNNVSAVMPKILARGLMTLREQAIMPRLVNGDYSAIAAEKGDTIDVPVPAELSATDVTPDITPPVPEDVAIRKVQIELKNWKKAGFHLTDKEMMEVEGRDNFLPMQAGSAIRALANAVNQSIHAEYTGVYGLVGDPAQVPFSGGSGDAIDARKLLLQQRAPKENRYGVLNFDAEASALDLSAFADADKAGTSEVKIDGEIGRKYGINWFSDDHVMTHVTGAAGAAVVVDEGSSGNTLVLTGLAARPAVGDVLTIEGSDQQYVVRAATELALDQSTLTIDPPLVTDPAGAENVSFVPSHTVNLVFNRDALAFANRPLAHSTQDMGLGNQIMSMTDPVTGLSLRLEVSRQYKQVVWEFDILWGVKLVRPEFAVRLAGKP
ncbi:P22 phage major capsid protein family protein [Sneathiella chinensis]|uniref:Major capsid protein n=1 Tax=Sneathiella chinensis TaxID=349750 RepID=A0ABQ5U6V5_9PROT|nr:P22 phage major capsid protein family protein [Sneathiella chinensis]GLQ07516.1 hypothetical protein GCM10007924_27370 [Sneathiella chinensis]